MGTERPWDDLGMTLATGNALCDVKVNYFREKCQPALMSLRHAGRAAPWHAGHLGALGGRKVLGVVNTFQILLLAPLWALGV